MGNLRRYGVLAISAMLALALSGCARTPTPVTEEAISDVPTYTSAERSMLAMGHEIDGLFSLTTPDETWLAIQRQNCDVARSLAGASPSSVSWYVPAGDIESPYLDDQNLLGSSVGASLVSGCIDLIDFSWTWPELWAYIRTSGSGTNSRVQCDDGTWSSAGGTQGACSWHGGVDD